MTHQQPSPAAGTVDPGRQIAQLRHVLVLVRQMAGSEAGGDSDAALDEAARVSLAYADALPLHRRRFDRLAAETARWAAAGVEALLAVEERGKTAPAAAARLAGELERALSRLSAILA
jgi:hypothetical protein